MSHSRIVLDGSTLSIDRVVSVARENTEVEISRSALDKVKEGRDCIERMLASGGTYYGINTGFGKLADRKIPKSDLESLQKNLIRSHSVGVGSPLDEPETRALMVVRLNSLLKGNSGVSVDVVKQLQLFLNNRIFPMIPRFGSLGASGDLAPSAHLALCLIGEGFVFEKGIKVRTEEALKNQHLRPIALKAKEGLSIINGTQVMTAIGCLLIHDTEVALKSLDVIAAMSLEALEGSTVPFDERVQKVRPHQGQIEVAERIVHSLRNSSLVSISERVQDPYSFRCVPQVHGAFQEVLNFARSILTTELNSVTDNPIVFPETDEIMNTGNFHGQIVSLALDMLCISLCEASVISERRIDKLLSGFNPNLPLFLTPQPGLNSGLMVTQYSAAALVAHNRTLSQPASLDSADVSAGQEDHASMGVNAALKGQEVLQNTFTVLAIEALCAAQALDLLTDPDKKAGQGTLAMYREIRKLSDKLDNDRSLSGEITRVADALRVGMVNAVLNSVR
jgi:histidine ammonia-lyase